MNILQIIKIAKSSLKTLADRELNLATKRAEDDNFTQYFHNLEYASLLNPANAPVIKSNARFKETQYFRKKGEKAIEAENSDLKEVKNSVDKPEGTPLNS